MSASLNYRKKLRERLLGKDNSLAPMAAQPADLQEGSQQASAPFDLWKDAPEAKRNLSENLVGNTPLDKWDWNSKAGHHDINLFKDDKPHGIIKEEAPAKKVDDFKSSKYKVI